MDERVHIRAKMMQTEDLINEVGALAELGEEIPAALFPEYVQKAFETGETLRAREEISARMQRMDGKTGVRVAWICYKARAYDLACTLFLAYLHDNKSNYKYLRALESAAESSTGYRKWRRPTKRSFPKTAISTDAGDRLLSFPTHR